MASPSLQPPSALATMGLTPAGVMGLQPPSGGSEKGLGAWPPGRPLEIAAPHLVSPAAHGVMSAVRIYLYR